MVLYIYIYISLLMLLVLSPHLSLSLFVLKLNRIDFVVTVSYIISLAVVNNMQEANNKSNLSALFLVIQLLRVFDFIRLAPMSKSFMNVLESVKTAQRAIIISICITFCFW